VTQGGFCGVKNGGVGRCSGAGRKSQKQVGDGIVRGRKSQSVCDFLRPKQGTCFEKNCLLVELVPESVAPVLCKEAVGTLSKATEQGKKGAIDRRAKKGKVNMLAKLLQTKLTVLALCWAGLLFAGQVQANCMAPEAAAEETELSPYQLIGAVTDEVLAEIDRHRAELDASAEETVKQQQFDCFVGQVDRILGKVVDFDWIALKVMGNDGKIASAEQKALFAETFRTGLVETYGRGLLSYSSEKIVLLPAEKVGDRRKITVHQQIVGEEATYPLDYTMGLKGGQWKVINVIINGINLGKTFRGQFTQASQKNKGDIDKVIAGWDSGINNG